MTDPRAKGRKPKSVVRSKAFAKADRFENASTAADPAKLAKSDRFARPDRPASAEKAPKSNKPPKVAPVKAEKGAPVAASKVDQSPVGGSQREAKKAPAAATALPAAKLAAVDRALKADKVPKAGSVPAAAKAPKADTLPETAKAPKTDRSPKADKSPKPYKSAKAIQSLESGEAALAESPPKPAEPVGPFRSGFVAVVGRPNVGKSTLVNKLVGQKVAITSDRPQTTRHQIRGVVTRPNSQMVFVDTPGIHKPLHLLGEQLVKSAIEALDSVELRVFMVDCQVPAGKGDQFIAELLKKSQKPTVLVLNKADRVQAIPERIFAGYKALGDFVAVVPLSARTGRNVKGLLEEITALLPEGPRYYDEDIPTDQTLRQIAGELIREQLMRQLGEELPHSIAVMVESFDESKTPVHIGATIYVERKSQKGIVIGEGGARLKAVGVAARTHIESQLGAKVYLELWVKVLENWRKDRADLKRLGYVVD
jgi:GTP-binding protein Era